MVKIHFLKYGKEIYYLNIIIIDNMELLKETSQQKKIKIVFSDDKDYVAFADQNMINMVVRNLLTNAIKFTKPEGTVRIDIKNENEFLHTMISDTGIGIAPEEIEKLFRVDVHFTREGTEGEAGTGLGLILCKEYIVKNNGKIWVESELNKGSTFHFTLPQGNTNL